MGKYNIYPMHVGDLERQKSNLAYMKYPGEKIIFPIICWYVTDGERKIMVDTGGAAPDGKRWMPSYRTPEQEPSYVLKKLGVDPAEITDVILTHLHWDHAGNNHLFTNARFWVQRDELREAACPSLKLFAGSYDYDEIFKWKYEVIDGDVEIMEGISVIKTPGHSVGSQSVIVETEDGPYVIAGDLVGLFECWESDPMIPNGIHIDLNEYYESFEKVKALHAFVLPGHDIKVFEHDVYPADSRG